MGLQRTRAMIWTNSFISCVRKVKLNVTHCTFLYILHNLIEMWMDCLIFGRMTLSIAEDIMA